MSEERLKELKDSLEVGLTGAKLQALNYAEGVYEDALELYNEVIRLREKLNQRNIAGIQVVVSGETYNEYKGTLQDQISELQKRIDEAIKEINYWGVDKEHNDNSAMRCALINILDLLNGDKDL